MVEQGSQFTEDHPDIQISPEQERDDMMTYLDELEKRLPRYAQRSAALRPEEPGSVEWSRAVGKYWRNARETHNLSRYGLAARTNTHVNNIRFLEGGLVEMEELQGFLEPYAQAIGDPNLYTEFSQRFGIGQTTPPIPPQA